MTTSKEPQPNIIDGVPFCSDEDCPLYDGKRCEALGARPGNICEPAVGSMAVDLSTTIANHRATIKALDASRAEAAEAREAIDAAADMAEDWTCPGCDEDHGPNLAAAIRSLKERKGT